MKLYFPIQHYDAAYRSQVFPLLKPFIKNEGFTDAERQSAYGVSECDFKLVDTMESAKVAILPMSWDYYSLTNQMSLAYSFIEEAENNEKLVWSINNGDFGVIMPSFKNHIVFRQSGYVSNKQLGHTGFPSIIGDYIKKHHLEYSFFNGSYDAKPIVGFCGQTNISKSNALKEMTKQVLRNLRSQIGFNDLEPQKILSTSFLRGFLLKQLEEDMAVECRFIKHKNYRAGIITKNKETHPTTIAFYKNILESQYVLCVRGAGNFSVRFYETLMMGRIPIYVHTDGYLPLPDVIDWKSHVVWVDYKDRHRIAEILLEFHEELDQERLTTMFKKNRKLWEEKLTLSGFFKSIL